MKKVFPGYLLILFTSVALFSQWSGYSHTTGGSEFDGGLGMTWIDEEPYYTIMFQPDLTIGNFGIGLNLSLLYNTDDGKLRAEDWDSGYDFVRIIRYLRYGHKGDKLYARAGALDATRLGHGFIMNYYNNQIQYDDRKLGLVLDIDFGNFGFESVTNNLGHLEVIGGRGYVRPLFNKQIPIIRNIAFGLSYVTDVDLYNPIKEKGENVSVWGIDTELPLLKTEMLKVMFYADHAKIINHGSGQTIGFLTEFNTLWGFLGLTFNIERRFLGREFMASYFGPFYEILRNTTSGEIIDYYYSLGGDSLGIPEELDTLSNAISVNQKTLLPMIVENRKAWYGALDLNFFRLIRAFGSFQMIDGVGNSGILHLGLGLAQSIPYIALEATYDKRGIATFKNIFTLDYRSVARIGIGYKIKPWLLFYVDYIWNFIYDENEEVYKPSERIQPRFSIRYPINL
jgi:hypothetical protein